MPQNMLQCAPRPKLSKELAHPPACCTASAHVPELLVRGVLQQQQLATCDTCDTCTRASVPCATAPHNALWRAGQDKSESHAADL
jgi:hypothetical protein